VRPAKFFKKPFFPFQFQRPRYDGHDSSVPPSNNREERSLSSPHLFPHSFFFSHFFPLEIWARRRKVSKAQDSFPPIRRAMFPTPFATLLFPATVLSPLRPMTPFLPQIIFRSLSGALPFLRHLSESTRVGIPLGRISCRRFSLLPKQRRGKTLFPYGIKPLFVLLV